MSISLYCSSAPGTTAVFTDIYRHKWAMCIKSFSYNSNLVFLVKQFTDVKIATSEGVFGISNITLLYNMTNLEIFHQLVNLRHALVPPGYLFI